MNTPLLNTPRYTWRILCVVLALASSGAFAGEPTLRDTIIGSRKSNGISGTPRGTYCQVDEDCTDHNPCTADSCNRGTCVFAALQTCAVPCKVDADCDDGDSSTPDVCEDGQCRNQSILGGGISCTDDSTCVDRDPCTNDVCLEGTCRNIERPECTPCDADGGCRTVEAVFVVDTSGSITDDAIVLCDRIDELVAAAADQGLTVMPYIYGITDVPAVGFDCLAGNVANVFGVSIPGGFGECAFPGGSDPKESWGPGTAIVAERFPWSAPGLTVRLIIPISDEAACNGSVPEGCNDPGDDRAAIEAAVAAAVDSGVVVSPIISGTDDACVLGLAGELADRTGGTSYTIASPFEDLAPAISDLLLGSCVIGAACEDGVACTVDECDPVSSTCVFVTDDANCSDGDFCNGLETCEPADGCVAGAPPDCDDQSVCTDDFCDNDAGSCVFEANYDASIHCCDPVSGALAEMDDRDPCTDDLCDPQTGNIEHVPSAVGTPCDDGAVCTIMDACDNSGACSGVEPSSISCVSSGDCPGGVCNVLTGACSCRPELCLEAFPTKQPELMCQDAADDLVVNVVIREPGVMLNGAQFVVPYDPALLEFVSVDTGRSFDPESPFVLEVFSEVDEVAGRVVYAIGVSPEQPPAISPVVIATMRFRPLVACDQFELCFLSENPLNTLLTLDGQSLPFTPCCTGEIQIDDGPPALQCPESVEVAATPGNMSATVTWDPITASDACDDNLIRECTGAHESGFDVTPLIETGGLFPVGEATIGCTVADGCGAMAQCDWTVTVLPENVVLASVHLSPTMMPGPLTRCIEFDFYSSCAEPVQTVMRDINFGLPFDLPGRAKNVWFSIPAGDYFCVTARDPMHSLRALASTDVLDDHYVISFKNDPALGGNWLVGGNLNGDHVIDVMDSAIFMEQEFSAVPVNTHCTGFVGPHADINGDGIVDSLDWSFIQANYLTPEPQPGCCPDQIASSTYAPRTSVSVKQLQRWGLGHLSVADLNSDGVVDDSDIDLYNDGVRPNAAAKSVGGRNTAFRKR